MGIRVPSYLDGASFAAGGLQLTSYVRPGKLFTANEALMLECVGQLHGNKLSSILKAVAELFMRDP